MSAIAIPKRKNTKAFAISFALIIVTTHAKANTLSY